MLKFKSLSKLLRSNPTEQDCINYLEEIIWKGKMPTSPFDPISKVYKCANNRYKCKNTGKYFTAKSLTVFRNSKISLLDWFWALCFYSNKKSISSCQLAKNIGITQKSAWFVLHRSRHTFKDPIFKAVLGGSVEIDETFVGGKNKNRHWDKKVPNSQGRSWKDKMPVLVIIERGGNAISWVVPNTQQNIIEPIIREHVKEGSNVYTDEWFAYKDLKNWYNHEIVNHRIKQYKNGEASTNSAENFNSHFKRLINGTYHQVSKKYLQKYADEITFKFNTRKHNEQEKFDLMLLASIGKSLSYNQLTSSF